MTTEVDHPAEFLCPISNDLMRRLVRLEETSAVYDEDSIANWFAMGKATCPNIGQTMQILSYDHDAELQSRIDEWKAETGFVQAP